MSDEEDDKPWFCTDEWHRECDENRAARKRQHEHPWPMVSEAFGCHPEQAAEFNEESRKMGITGVYYRPDGQAVIDSQREYNRAARLRNMYHKGEGYHC